MFTPSNRSPLETQCINQLKIVYTLSINNLNMNDISKTDRERTDRERELNALLKRVAPIEYATVICECSIKYSALMLHSENVKTFYQDTVKTF